VRVKKDVITPPVKSPHLISSPSRGEENKRRG